MCVSDPHGVCRVDIPGISISQGKGRARGYVRVMGGNRNAGPWEYGNESHGHAKGVKHVRVVGCQCDVRVP